MPRFQNINQAASSGCSTKVAGIKKVWLFDMADVTSVEFTEAATYVEVTDITMVGANKLFEMEFTRDNTAYINQTQANAGEAVDIGIFFTYDGISKEKIDMLNGAKDVCQMGAFVQLSSGKIIYVGHDYDTTADEHEAIPKPLQLKGQVNSGLGNNDSEKVVFEFIGQSKYFCRTTGSALDATALNAL